MLIITQEQDGSGCGVQVVGEVEVAGEKRPSSGAWQVQGQGENRFPQHSLFLFNKISNLSYFTSILSFFMLTVLNDLWWDLLRRVVGGLKQQV